eukprot:8266752-Ditylum_brightwellii.AAC.1
MQKILGSISYDTLVKWQEEVKHGFNEQNKYVLSKEFKDNKTFQAKQMAGAMEAMANKLIKQAMMWKYVKTE